MMKSNGDALMTLDSEQLRRAMRAWTTGVAVITAQRGDIRQGMTINSFTSLSLDPPLIMVALQGQTRTHALVKETGEFSVTILAEDQRDLSIRFARHEVEDRFTGIETEALSLRAPLIKGGLAWFDCRVRQSHEVGENTLFVAEVEAVRVFSADKPLAYHNREYWKLSNGEGKDGIKSPDR
jgi:flavin reductase (DIM6/NTAB) family NADH-FMN oxidoreductase RutF